MKTIHHFFKKPYIYLIIIVIGVLLKFYGLENRFFWIDEIYTIYHTSGIHTEEFLEQVPNDTIVNINYYNNLLNLNNGQHTIGSQLSGLSQMAQFTPLHYVFLVFWQRIVGPDYLDYRLFTILIFLLTLPLLYSLSRLLFKSRLAGLIATSFYAVSPFMHTYAQDARYYILWAFSMILSHFLLLKVLNKNTMKWWILYSLAAIMSLYVSTLSSVIILGHFMYVLIFYRKLWLRYCISVLIILVAYAPWVIEILNSSEEISSSLFWQTGYFSFWQILISPWLGMAHIFSYIDNFSDIYVLWTGDNYSVELILSVIINALLILVIAASIVFLIRKMPVKIVWFLLLIVIPGILFFNILDLTLQRYLSLVWRYHIVYFVGIILIVTLFFEKKISSGMSFYPLLYLGIVTVSIISMVKISADDCWATYNFEHCDEKIVAAEIFSNDKNPLIITDCNSDLGLIGFWETIVECSSENIDILNITDPENIGDLLIGKNYSNIYIYQASGGLIYKLLKQYKEHQLFEKLPKPILIQKYLNALLKGESPEIDSYTLEESAIGLSVCEIKFIVVPKILPPSSTIYITGNNPSIGNWAADKVALKEESNGNWRGTYVIDSGIILEYKFTRGDWENEFVDKNGDVFANRVLEVQKDTTITVIVENWKDLIK